MCTSHNCGKLLSWGLPPLLLRSPLQSPMTPRPSLDLLSLRLSSFYAAGCWGQRRPQKQGIQPNPLFSRGDLASSEAICAVLCWPSPGAPGRILLVNFCLVFLAVSFPLFSSLLFPPCQCARSHPPTLASVPAPSPQLCICSHPSCGSQGRAWLGLSLLNFTLRCFSLPLVLYLRASGQGTEKKKRPHM